MTDDKTYTKADLDAAIAAAAEKHDEDISGLKAKVNELIAANKALKRGAEIKPEDLQEAEARADRAEAALAEANKALKTAKTEAEKATKALETEQAAARSYAVNAELNSAIAEGNVAPALVPAFRALVAQQAKADVVDGQLAVLIGDKPARDYIKGVLASEEGKHFVAAPVNGGGGAPGGGTPGGAKVITRDEYNRTMQSGQIGEISAINNGLKTGEVTIADAA